MKVNTGIRCNVAECAHNIKDCKCNLDEVEIACGCEDQDTCCASFEEK